MKKRLITNGILSLIISVCCILLFVFGSLLFSKNSDFNWYRDWHRIYKFWSDNYLNNKKSSSEWEMIVFFVFWIIANVSWMVSFVMGILTLAMQKHHQVKGLTIASGIIAILGALIFVNIIVSFIAVNKINQTEKVKVSNENSDQDH